MANETLGSVADVLSIFTALGQGFKAYVATLPPGPAKDLRRYQKELDSIKLTLDMNKAVLPDTLADGFERRFLKIQIKMQKEEKLLAKLGTKEERESAVTRIDRIGGNIVGLKDDVLRSSVTARGFKSSDSLASSIQDNGRRSTTSWLSAFSSRVPRGHTSEADLEATAGSQNIDVSGPPKARPTSTSTSSPESPPEPIEEPSQPAPSECMFKLEQEDGSIKYFSSRELKANPSLAPPELLCAMLEIAEAYNRGTADVSSEGTSAQCTLAPRTGPTIATTASLGKDSLPRPMPTYTVGLGSIPEVHDQDVTESHD